MKLQHYKGRVFFLLDDTEMLELPCEQKSFVLVFESVTGNFSFLHKSSCMKGVVPSKISGTLFVDWSTGHF